MIEEWVSENICLEMTEKDVMCCSNPRLEGTLHSPQHPYPYTTHTQPPPHAPSYVHACVLKGLLELLASCVESLEPDAAFPVPMVSSVGDTMGCSAYSHPQFNQGVHVCEQARARIQSPG